MVVERRSFWWILVGAWGLLSLCRPAFCQVRLGSVASDLGSGVYGETQHRAAIAGLRDLVQRIARLGPTQAEKRNKLAIAVDDAVQREGRFWETLPESIRLGRAKAEGPEAQALSDRLRELDRISLELAAAAAAAPAPRAPAHAAIAGERLDGAVKSVSQAAVAQQTHPAAFWDNNTRRGDVGGVMADSFGEASHKPAAVTATEHRAAPAAPPVPAEVAAARKASAACRKELAEFPTVSRLCENHPTVAPVVAGVLDSFRQQFGTVEGILSNLAWILISLVMSVVSGFGMVAKIAMSLGGLALSAWMIWPLIQQGWGAFRDFRSSKEGTEERSNSLFRMGLAGGTLLILALLTAAGYELGKSQVGQKLFTSLDTTLSTKMSKMGISTTAAADPGWAASDVAGLFSNIETPVAKHGGRVAAAIGRGAQEAAEYNGGRGRTPERRESR